jgi:hypothetical protein
VRNNAKEKLQWRACTLSFKLCTESGARHLFCKDAMLSGLTKRFRLKAALVLVALYALCIFAPHAAMAFGNGAAHCLTDDMSAAHVHPAKAERVSHTHVDGVAHPHGDQQSHKHVDGSAPHENSDADGKNHSGTCCGLFCVSAIALDADTALAAPLAHSPNLPGLHESLAGRGPDRLIRPPIA